MREGAKHRVGCTVREEKTERLQRRGGMAMVGRLEEGLDRQREMGQKKGRDIVTGGGGGSGCVLPAQPVGTNDRETDSVVSNGKRSSLCLGCFPAPFIF